MKDGIAFVPAVLVKELSGFVVPFHRLRQLSHHVVQVADGAVKGGIAVVNLVLRISIRTIGRHGTGRHAVNGIQGQFVINQGAVVLLLAIKIQADVPVNVAVGRIPAARMADGKGLPGVEKTLFTVDDVVPQHQLPV